MYHTFLVCNRLYNSIIPCLYHLMYRQNSTQIRLFRLLTYLHQIQIRQLRLLKYSSLVVFRFLHLLFRYFPKVIVVLYPRPLHQNLEREKFLGLYHHFACPIRHLNLLYLYHQYHFESILLINLSFEVLLEVL